jgi:hypothetical protein
MEGVAVTKKEAKKVKKPIFPPLATKVDVQKERTGGISPLLTANLTQNKTF